MTNKQVAERWIIGKADCHTVNMLYENNTIYSMNYQFPIATIKGKIVYFNNTKHSRTATKHQKCVRGIIPARYNIIFVTTEKLKELLNM